MNERTANFKTECSKCVFFNDFGECNAGRLEKFKQKYGTLLYSTTDIPIIPTWCNMMRLKEFNVYSEELLKKTINECKLQSDIIILSYDENESVVRNNIIKSIKSISRQILKPNKIIVCIKNNNIRFGEIYKEVSTSFDIPIMLMRILEDDRPKSFCIDEAVRKCTSTFYIICESGLELSNDYISNLNKIINEDMQMFSSIIHKDSNILHGVVVQTFLHKILGGNRDKSVIEKITELAKEQKVENMVVTL